MMWVRVTWQGMGVGSYNTVERISLNEPMDAYLSGLKNAGAINAEIIKVDHSKQ